MDEWRLPPDVQAIGEDEIDPRFVRGVLERHPEMKTWETALVAARCFTAAGRVFARALAEQDARTPREAAEAAWRPGSPYATVDALEDHFRAERGLRPLERGVVRREPTDPVGSGGRVEAGADDELRMLTVAQVVRQTGMSEYAVRQAIKNGELGHKRRGRNLYVPAHALASYVRDVGAARSPVRGARPSGGRSST